MKKKNKVKLFEKRWFLLVFSLFLSIFVWVIIAGFVSPGEGLVEKNVTINYQKNDTTFKNRNLVMVGTPLEDVEVKMSGSDTVVWTLLSTDVEVTVDYSKVTGPGTYNLEVKCVQASLKTFEIAAWYPNEVTVTFEAVERKTLTIAAKADMVEAAPGYFKNTLQLSSSTIDITGPASLVDKVEQAVAVVKDEEVRNTQKHYTVPVRLLDANGNELDLTPFTLSVSEIEVTVPILEVRTFLLTVEVSGQPAGFDLEWFKSLLRFSVETIQIAGESGELDKITEISIGVIDLSTFDIGTSYKDFTVTLRKEFVNYSNLKTVTVTVDTEDVEEKTFTVPFANIRVVNTPPGLQIVPDETNITVTLAGPVAIIQRLLPENVIIQIDAFDITAGQGGQQSIAAHILVASNNRVFALGTYQVVCQVSVA